MTDDLNLYTLKARLAAFEAEMAAMEIKGGAGSGNWGHAGRPGKRGGSSSRGMGKYGAVSGYSAGGLAGSAAARAAAAVQAQPGAMKPGGSGRWDKHTDQELWNMINSVDRTLQGAGYLSKDQRDGITQSKFEMIDLLDKRAKGTAPKSRPGAMKPTGPQAQPGAMRLSNDAVKQKLRDSASKRAEYLKDEIPPHAKREGMTATNEHRRFGGSDYLILQGGGVDGYHALVKHSDADEPVLRTGVGKTVEAAKKKVESAITLRNSKKRDGAATTMDYKPARDKTTVQTGKFTGGAAKPTQYAGKMKTKMTIQSATKKLAGQGYKLGAGNFDIRTKQTTYEVTAPNGQKRTMTPQEIENLALKR